MNRDNKQIYVSLQIDNNEIKLLVGEYYNTRFNVIRLERLDTFAINNFEIIDKNQLIEDIKTVISTCSKRIGAKIEQAILLIPAYNFKKFAIKSTIVPEKGFLTKKDVARAISNSLNMKVDDDLMVINTMINKYTINDIVNKRFPENEPCNECAVDLDLLCADKKLTYQLVSVVENAGIEVLDICLNTYALAKEAALLEESLKQNVIVLDINREYSYFSLLSKGRLMTSEVVYGGLESMISAVYYKYRISRKDIKKLIKFNVNYNTEYANDVVYAYNEQGVNKSITAKDIDECISEPLNLLINKYLQICEPIMDEEYKLVITGEGQQMIKLVDIFKEKLGDNIKTYYPDTIGVRDPSLGSLYGTFFVYRDKVLLNNLDVNCVDIIDYEANIKTKDLNGDTDTITTKIKNIFRQYIGREEEK